MWSIMMQVNVGQRFTVHWCYFNQGIDFKAKYEKRLLVDCEFWAHDVCLHDLT